MIVIMSQNLSACFDGLPFQRRRFDKGTALFLRGDPVKRMFMIVKGRVCLTRCAVDGRMISLQRAQEREIVAEASLYADAYHCDGIAGAATEVKSFARSAIRRHLRNDKRFFDAWAAHLSREVQAARLRAEILALKTVAAKLDAWLTFHDNILPAKGGWKMLASEIGVSPEALYRELAGRAFNRRPSLG